MAPVQCLSFDGACRAVVFACTDSRAAIRGALSRVGKDSTRPKAEVLSARLDITKRSYQLFMGGTSWLSPPAAP